MAECSVYTQVTYGATRPDLLLKLSKGGQDIAWLDLTASDSVDHIFAKDGWDAKIGTFAEVTYPSLDPGTLALMVQNKANTGTLTEEEFKKRQEAARAAYLVRKAHWEQMGKDRYTIRNTRFAVFRKKKNLVIQNDPTVKQPVIKEALEKDFKTEIPMKMIPSILVAMGVNPTSWGFLTGTSMSERAGEAWLVDNDTTLPSSGSSSTKPREGVKQASVRKAMGEGRDKRAQQAERSRKQKRAEALSKSRGIS